MHTAGILDAVVCKAKQVGGLMSSKTDATTKKELDLHPSLASLGDGLPSSVGSQRDEAKRQTSGLLRT